MRRWEVEVREHSGYGRAMETRAMETRRLLGMLCIRLNVDWKFYISTTLITKSRFP